MTKKQKHLKSNAHSIHHPPPNFNARAFWSFYPFFKADTEVRRGMWVQASGDTKLSSIVRAIDEDIRPIYTEKILSRNLDDETLEASVAKAVLKDGARSLRSHTLLLVDPTEIRKEFSYKMEFVSRVRDASRSSKEGRDVLVNGYHGCMVAACRSGGCKTVPLALKLWSPRSPGFKGENDEVLKIIYRSVRRRYASRCIPKRNCISLSSKASDRIR